MKRRGEQGFAMLLVFVMAASVAIMLYRELPRVAFEAQRQKEELLIARGEEYKRAIQLYYRKTKQYPPTMEALENTNGVRFLRRKYVDPITGKSEWRIIHIGPGGVFTDSLVNKPPSAEGDKAKSVNTFTYEAPALGASGQTGAGMSFQAVRPSEQRMAQSIAQGQPGQAQGPVDPNNPPPPGTSPGLSTQAAYQAYLQQLPQEQRQNASQADFQNFLQKLQQQQPGIPIQPGVPGQVPGAAGPPQQSGSQFVGGSSFIGAPSQPGPSPYSTMPGAQGAPAPFGQPGAQAIPGAVPNPALDLIRQSLFNPRPNAPPGVAQTGGAQITGGIAGVASTAERSGIKVYNDREKYNEWEFLYDLTKDKSGGTPTQGVSGLPGAQNPQQQGNSPFGPPPRDSTGSQQGSGSPFIGGAPGGPRGTQPGGGRR
jgi:hypothetical protein